MIFTGFLLYSALLSKSFLPHPKFFLVLLRLTSHPPVLRYNSHGSFALPHPLIYLFLTLSPLVRVIELSQSLLQGFGMHYLYISFKCFLKPISILSLSHLNKKMLLPPSSLFFLFMPSDERKH